MKTEAKKKTGLSAVPEAALEEAGLAKETILAAIPMDGVVLVTKDSMPIVELLQMLDRLNLYAAEMLTAVAAECGPCEKADEALTVEDVLEECEVTIPAWAREQAGIPENAKLACFVNEGEVIVGEAEACAPDLADVPRYVLKFFVDNHLNLRALDDMLNVWITPVPCSCEVSDDAEYPCRSVSCVHGAWNPCAACVSGPPAAPPQTSRDCRPIPRYIGYACIPSRPPGTACAGGHNRRRRPETTCAL